MKMRINRNKMNLHDIAPDIAPFFAGQFCMDIVERFGTEHPDRERALKALNKFAKYVKFTRYNIAFQHGEFTQELLESMPIYNVVKNEYYKKGIKNKYFGARGASDELMERLHLTEDELDKRLINTFIGMTMFVGYASIYFYYFDTDSQMPLRDTNQALSEYASTACDVDLLNLSPWHIFYFYDSWLYTFVKSLAFPLIMRNAESSIETNILMIQELLTTLFTIMLNKPEDCLWLTGLGYYYIQYFKFSMDVAYTLANLDLFALTTPKSISDAYTVFNEEHKFKVFIKEYESAGNTACALQLGAVVSKDDLKKLPKIYRTAWQRNTDTPTFLDRLTPYVSLDNGNIYSVYNGESYVRKYVQAIHRIFESIEDVPALTIKDFNAQYSKLVEQSKKEDSDIFMPSVISEFDFNNYRGWYVNSDAVREDFRHISSMTGVILAAQARTLQTDLLAAKTKLDEQTSAIANLQNIETSLAQYKKNYERSQQKLLESRDKVRILADENTKLKREAESRISGNKALMKITELQKQLDTERATTAKLRNRVKTLEDGDRNVDALIARIAELEKSVAAEKHLAELVMSEPVEDTRELTHEELTQLRTIKAHLIVPDMSSFKELNKLMPNSVFTYNPNDRNIRLRVAKGCDIFFFCTKFCCHGDWWNWLKQLSNVPERCIYAHTAGKYNVARLILAKAKELGLFKDTGVSSEKLASVLGTALK